MKLPIETGFRRFADNLGVDEEIRTLYEEQQKNSLEEALEPIEPPSHSEIKAIRDARHPPWWRGVFKCRPPAPFLDRSGRVGERPDRFVAHGPFRTDQAGRPGRSPSETGRNRKAPSTFGQGRARRGMQYRSSSKRKPGTVSAESHRVGIGQ
jgi:hypothetical protein